MAEHEPGHLIETQPHAAHIDAGVVVSILEAAEREDQPPRQGLTDAEYIGWVYDVIRFGFSTEQHIIKDAAHVRSIAAGLDGYFDDPAVKGQPSLSIQLRQVADELARRYRENAEATRAELNQFMMQHPGLFVDAKTGAPVTELLVEQQPDGVYELTLEHRRIALTVDVTKLSENDRQVVEKVVSNPDEFALYAQSYAPSRGILETDKKGETNV